MGKLERMAQTPRPRIDENFLEKLEDLDPQQLKKVVKLAKAENPPNEAVIGLVGGFAYANSIELADGPDYIPTVEKAFPNANVDARYTGGMIDEEHQRGDDALAGSDRFQR